MTIVFYIFLAICELAFACIILTEIYWLMVFIAERIVKPLWYKLNDFILGIYCWMLTEEFLRREEVKDGERGHEPAGPPAEPAGPGPGERDDPAPRD